MNSLHNIKLNFIEGLLINSMNSEAGCPLCSVVLDYEFEFLAKLQYKVSNDSSFRKEIANKGGFCDYHFRQFKKIANKKTNILLLKSIIEEKFYHKEKFIIDCCICKAVNNYERKCIETFIKIFQDDINKKKYEETNGICFIHLMQIKNITGDINFIHWLEKNYIQHIEKLGPVFEEMSNRSFYEIEREKRMLINVLIEKLTGRKSRSL